MKQYLDLLQKILNEGTKKESRQGGYTLSLFGESLKFALHKGFPIVTTKRVPWKMAIREFLVFLSGADDLKSMLDAKVPVWTDDAWARFKIGLQENDAINSLSTEEEKKKVFCEHILKDDTFNEKWGTKLYPYGKNFKRYPSPNNYKIIKERHITDNTKYFSETIVQSVITPADIEHKYIGKKFTNKWGDEFIVINNTKKKKNNSEKLFTIQFTKTKWVAYVRGSSIKNRNFRDQSLPTVYGIGSLGNFQPKAAPSIDKKLRIIWEGMMSRCYSSLDKSYKNHGGDGVKVCNRWQTLSCFSEDVKHIPGWEDKKISPKKYALDKDFYGNGKLYHPDTCVWISKKDNNRYRKDAIAIELSNEDGDIWIVPTMGMATAIMGANEGFLKRHIKAGEECTCNGITAKAFKKTGYVIRKMPSVNQIEQVLTSLKNNPYGRRHLLTGFHPEDEKNYYLISCHGISTQFNVRPWQYRPKEMNLETADTLNDIVANGVHKTNKYPDKILDLSTTIRSSDSVLGLPFNIVQYGAFLTMMAHLLGYAVGNLIINLGDVHIYEQHFDAVKEQLKRDTKRLPTMSIINNIQSIDDFKIEDFELPNYESHEKIKAELIT